MKTIKSILLVFTAALILASCSEDPVLNPPTAGFTVSDTAPTQWDEVVIISTAIAADDISYTVTGGNFNLVDGTIMFLEAKTYNVVQTVTNVDGTDESSVEVVVSEPDNTYILEGTEMSLTSNAFWYDASAQGGTIYIRFLADVAGQDNPNLIKLYPVAGANPLQATYTWADDGTIGTYDAGMTADYAGMTYAWTTSGNDGGDLVIELVYEGATAAENIYDITLSTYDLSYGQWDFASCFCFIPEGNYSLVVTYRGVIDPAA
jgi:WD40 repeat protein